MPADVPPPITKTKITTQWGSQVSADLSELWTALGEIQPNAGITVEQALDAVGGALIAGSNIDIFYDDQANTILISVEQLTKTDVGLGNVDNTTDVAKPISMATQTALDAKANDIATTNALAGKQPLDTDLTVISGLIPAASDTLQYIGTAWANRTPAEVKTTLALNNVSNTADANKPVSTAQQTALDLKVDKTAARVGWLVTRTSLAIPNNATTNVTWDGETTDTNGYIPASGSTVTIPAGFGGVYGVHVRSSWNTSQTGTQCVVEIVQNSNVMASSQGSAFSGVFSVSYVGALAAGDTLYVRVSQNSGGTIPLTNAGFSGYRLAN